MVEGISGVRRGPWRAARPWLLASAATLAALAAGRPALAAPICTPGGVPSAGATVTCVSDGAVATGITYASGAPDMTLVLDGTTSGALTILSGIVPPSPQGAVTLVPNSAATPSRITTTGTVSITTTGNNNGGLFIDGSSAAADVGITVASGTTIDTSGTDAYGAYAGTFIGGNATVTASGGSITTGGDFSHALFAEAFAGSATVTIDGSTGTTSIVTSGIDAYGAYARSSGAAEALVSLAGDPATVTVTTTGNGSYGLHALNTGAGTARISISGGTISTSDAAARGAFAAALGAGAATVEISGGSIVTLGNAAIGARALNNNTGAATVTQTGGTVATSGTAAYGLSAETASGLATVAAGGSIATSGGTAHGAYALSTSGAATVTVSGLITTGADGAHGAFAEVGASGTASAQVIMTGGSVTTGVDALGNPTGAGANASGLFAQSLGTGAARVEVTGGTIITRGDSSGGVLAGGAVASSAGGAATVTVTGGITTHGFRAVGAASAGATGATVTLIGANIATGSQDSYGAHARLGGSGLAIIAIDAASTITTQDINAHGAYALVASGTGSALVVNAGSVATAGAGAAGLYASVLAGAAEIRNAGSVATTGSGAAGIIVVSGGAATIISSGSIATTGASAIGAFATSLAASAATASITVSGSILTGDAGAAAGAYGAYARTGASSGLASVTLLGGGGITTTGPGGFAAFADSQAGGDAEVRSAGTITTQGERGRGALARVFAGTGNALVVNAGSLATAGLQAHGLEAWIQNGATGSATVTNSGSVTTAGEGAIGLWAHSAGGDAVVTQAGSVATSGAGAHGILVEATGAATVTSSGSISATSAAASGIFIAGAAGGYSITVTGGTITGGSIDATLGTGAGITIASDASGIIDIAAGATVQAASGVAIQDGAGALALTSRGTILGSISAGAGNDQVTLEAGSVTQGQVLLGAGDDLAVLRAGADAAALRAAADVAGVTLFDGEGGSDTLRLEGAAVTGGAQFANWEVLSLTQGARLTLNGDIVMGGADTLTGTVTIDATSTLAAPGDRTIRAYDAASLVTVTNAGLIQIASGSAAGNTLTIAGNYVGQGGSIALNTVLADDGSASDRLVISGGRASGDTILRITNLGGTGVQTVAGIRVVETRNGGTTDAGAFRLNTRVAAGGFEYQLFRGGGSSAEDWYLRSFLIPETPGTPTGPAVPLYQPEVSLYAPLAAVARQMGLSTLGTLEARRSAVGEVPDAGGTLGKEGAAPGHAAWARVIGERSRSRWDGTVDARATGNLIGLQAGFDILQTQPYADGHRDIIGVYVAYTDFNAPSVSGFALGQRNLRVGRLLVSGPAAGAYWTHVGPSGWYVDAVVQANWFDVSARSDFGTGLSTNGVGYAASLAAGYPIRIAAGWQVEPSAQLVWQGVSVDRARDQLSTVAWDAGDAVTGRIGARLQYTGRDERTLWQPYAKLNLWHAFSGNDRVSLGGGAPFENRFGETALEVGAGVTARVNEATSFYAHADYRWSVAGDSRQTAVQGSIGIRVAW